jgi:hypothetical protein
MFRPTELDGQLAFTSDRIPSQYENAISGDLESGLQECPCFGEAGKIMINSGAHRLRLCGSPSMSPSLTHYPAAGSQPRHDHAEGHVSFLLAGTILERLDGREYRVQGVARGTKPPGEAHQNEWGMGGALILTIKLKAVDWPEEETPGWKLLAEPASPAGSCAFWAVQRMRLPQATSLQI